MVEIRRSVLLFAGLAILPPNAGIAQTPAAQVRPLRDCMHAGRGEDCAAVVDRLQPVLRDQMRVLNNNRVFIDLINSSPFEVCGLESQVPIPSASTNRASARRQMRAALMLLESSRSANSDVRNSLVADIAGRLDQVERILGEDERFFDSQFVFSEGSQFGFLPTFSGAGRGQTGTPLEAFTRSTTGLRLELARVITDAGATSRRLHAGPPEMKDPALSSIFSLALEGLDSGLALAVDDLALLLDPRDIGRRRFPIYGSAGKAIDTAVVCYRLDTGRLTVRLPVRVSYGDIRGVYFSAGFLVSAVRPQQFSAESDISLEPNQRVIVEGGSRPEIVPFVFLSFKVHEKLNLGVGAGLNFYDHVKVDFAFGPMTSFGNLVVGGGIHLTPGSVLSGGYHVGDILDSSQEVPTSHAWRIGFGVFLGYRFAIK
jgi:hypothetical protein